MLPRVDRLSLVDSQAVSRWGDERAARERMESPRSGAAGAVLVSALPAVGKLAANLADQLLDLLAGEVN